MSSSNGKRQLKSDSGDSNKDVSSDDLSPDVPLPATKKQKTTDSIKSSKSATHASAPICSTPTLYVSNLHSRVAEPHLEKLFQRFGEINKVNMIRRTSTVNVGVRKGGESSSSSKSFRQKHHQPNIYSYAFVEFKSVEAANQAMNALNGVKLLGKDMVVKPAHAKTGEEHSDGANVSEENAEVKKKKSDVESKIDALKRALREKQRK